MSRGAKRRIAHVSTFPPLKCGIASFATDLISAVPTCDHARYVLHYGDPGAGEWAGHADVNSTDELANLGRLISASCCDIVCLQHEFGIWGGLGGENIHVFLDNLAKPVLSVLHTTFAPGVRSLAQIDIVVRLLRQSTTVVVFTVAAKDSVEMLAGNTVENLVVIPHGLPDYAYVVPPPLWTREKQGGGRPLRLITPGHFRQDKGFEVVLHAIRELRDEGYPISYLMAGEPQRQFAQQETYYGQIRGLIDTLQLGSEIQIDGRYLSLDEQAAVIQQSHVGVFAYQDRSQASSGTVPLVMSMGRPVLCTPFEYAKAKARETPGVILSEHFDAPALAHAIKRFMHMKEYTAVAKATYDRTRPWLWAAVGRTFEQLFVAGC